MTSTAVTYHTLGKNFKGLNKNFENNFKVTMVKLNVFFGIRKARKSLWRVYVMSKKVILVHRKISFNSQASGWSLSRP